MVSLATHGMFPTNSELPESVTAFHLSLDPQVWHSADSTAEAPDIHFGTSQNQNMQNGAGLRRQCWASCCFLYSVFLFPFLIVSMQANFIYISKPFLITPSLVKNSPKQSQLSVLRS